MSFIISLDDANAYIKNYIDTLIAPNPSDQGHRNNKDKCHGIIGGMIDAAPFQELYRLDEQKNALELLFLDPPITIGPKDGLVCWFCYDNSVSTRKDKYFLAFEVYKDFKASTADSFNPEPQSNTLLRPTEVYTVARHQGNDDHSKVIQTHNGKNGNYFITTDNNLKSTIDKGNGNNDRKAYHLIKTFDTKGARSTTLGREYNKVPFGFFHYLDDKQVRKFLSRSEVSHIRYYFGYDGGSTYNKIRIILVGVDKDGNNILPTNPSKATDNILQKAWPPPK